MVKCTGAIFICEWIESIGWTPEKIVILLLRLGAKFYLSLHKMHFSFVSLTKPKENDVYTKDKN